MTTSRPADALRQYSNMGLQGLVEEASPHELVRLLFDGALARIAAARGHMQRGEIAAKGDSLGRAISIIEALRENLDAERGGEVAANLDRLYDYMTRQLLLANLRDDAAALDEVHGLLAQVRDGWVSMPPETQPAPARYGASSAGAY